MADALVFRLVSEARSGQPLDAALPAGTYYVGDPCYVLDAATLTALSDLVFPPTADGGYGVRDVHVVSALAAGGVAHAVVFRTAHGDGGYFLRRPDGTTARCGVDSGGLAVIDTRLCRDGNGVTFGALVELAGPTAVRVEGHNLAIGAGTRLLTNADPDNPDSYDEDDDG